MSAEWGRRDFRGRHTAWPAATRLDDPLAMIRLGSHIRKGNNLAYVARPILALSLVHVIGNQ